MNVTNFDWYVGIDIGDNSILRWCDCTLQTIQDSFLDVLEQKPNEERLGHSYPVVMRAVLFKEERLHSSRC